MINKCYGMLVYVLLVSFLLVSVRNTCFADQNNENSILEKYNKSLQVILAVDYLAEKKYLPEKFSYSYNKNEQDTSIQVSTNSIRYCSIKFYKKHDLVPVMESNVSNLVKQDGVGAYASFCLIWGLAKGGDLSKGGDVCVCQDSKGQISFSFESHYRAVGEHYNVYIRCTENKDVVSWEAGK